MEKELKEKWIEALRSDVYEQGRENLKSEYHNGSEYCCLGVLLEIDPRFTYHDGFETTDPQVLSFYNVNYDSNLSTGDVLEIREEEFPDWLKAFYGMPGDIHDTLVDMNDNQGCPFSEIANYVEKSL